jgi:hypothetical protein
MKPLTKLVLALLALVLLSPQPLLSQSGDDAASREEKLADIIKAQNAKKAEKEKAAQNEEDRGGNLPEFQSPFKIDDKLLDEANRANKQQAIAEFFTHVTESNQHQRNVFRWQLLSSRILFVIVLVLVAAGIYFAAVQFHNDLKKGKEGAASTIKFGQDGIEVSSSVLGVIILVISLLFFYLYLVFIYPIEFVK